MIRRAQQSDIPRLQELLAQILEVHHLVRPDLFQKTGSKFTDQELQNLIDDPKKPTFVYLDDKGRVQGHLFTIIEEVPSGGTLVERRTLFIDDLCVDQEARGQGIGEKLYQYALDYARQIGCYNVTLHVWNDNTGALRFYERLGMKPQFTRMEEILDLFDNYITS